MTRHNKSRSAAGRRSKRSSRKTRKVRKVRRARKQRGGSSEGFNDRVPDEALVVVRNAEEDDSPFVVMTKEDALKNYTLGANRL
jgi:hypothetical protein